MQDTELYRHILGLLSPRSVASVRFMERPQKRLPLLKNPHFLQRRDNRQTEEIDAGQG